MYEENEEVDTTPIGEACLSNLFILLFNWSKVSLAANPHAQPTTFQSMATL